MYQISGKVKRCKRWKILELISDDSAITTSKLADMLSVTRKTISTHMKIMKKNNVIERIGSDRKGYWKIL